MRFPNNSKGMTSLTRRTTFHPTRGRHWGSTPFSFGPQCDGPSSLLFPPISGWNVNSLLEKTISLLVESDLTFLGSIFLFNKKKK